MIQDLLGMVGAWGGSPSATTCTRAPFGLRDVVGSRSRRDRDALQVGSLPEFLELFAPLHFVQQASDLRIAVCVLLKFVTFTRNTAA